MEQRVTDRRRSTELVGYAGSESQDSVSSRPPPASRAKDVAYCLPQCERRAEGVIRGAGGREDFG